MNDEPIVREYTGPIDRFISRIIGNLHKYTIRAAKEPFREYPQTWYYVPHWPKWLRRAIQALCERRGHELSDTEWGYGGGGKVDRWCRWCDKRVQVPKEQANRQASGLMRSLIDKMDEEESPCRNQNP